ASKERSFYADLRAKAVFAQDEQKREYPNQNLASHVLGYASSEDVDFEGKAVSEIHGQDGIELSFDAKLNGVRGWRVTQTDRLRRELVAFREQDVEAQDGLNVVVTVDSVVQHIVETVLAEAMQKHSPVSASGLVVRPRTGEIL